MSLATLGIFPGIGSWLTSGIIQLVPNNFTFLAGTRIAGDIPLTFLNSIDVSRIGSALPDTGAGLELRAIGAVVIGGVPITGGRGGVVGTFFGVLLLGVISSMLNMLRVDPFLQDIAFGLLIVFAIGVSWLRTRVGSDG